MKKYIALKFILTLEVGLSVLVLGEYQDGLMDLCIDLFCIEECADPALIEINNIVDLLSIFACKVWITLEANPEYIWSSIWLLYSYLRRQNIYKLLSCAYSKLILQRYNSYLQSSALLNAFSHVIKEESSSCLPLSFVLFLFLPFPL